MGKPEIRFKGYTDEWEQRKLGDVLDDMYNGQTPSRNKSEYWNGNIKWLSSGELNRGTVYDSMEMITEDGQKSANLRIVPKGTFIMAITGLEAAGTRGNCALLGFDTTLNQSCMALFPKKDLLTSDFLFQWYRKVGEEYGINYTQGTKQQSYNAELIKILPISLPSVAEQRKIASYLSNLDHLITLHQRKCDEVKSLKKYMLQKMFPEKGKRVPEIRFDGFTEDWEQRKLGDLAEIVGGGTPSTSKNEYWDGEIDWYAPAEIANQIYVDSSERKITSEGFDNSSAKMLPIGTVLFTSRAGIGKMAILRKEACTNQGFQSIVPRVNELDSYFIFSRSEELKRYGEMVGAGSTFVEVSGKQMSAMPLLMPPTMDEQKKIGEYFSHLDHLITLHQHKCEELQKLKKFMLQNMFV